VERRRSNRAEDSAERTALEVVVVVVVVRRLTFIRTMLVRGRVVGAQARSRPACRKPTRDRGPICHG